MQIISRAEAKEKGLKHYFTGKPCIRGHVSLRIVSDFSCTVCRAEQSKRWHARPENKQKKAQKIREFRKENPQIEKERAARYRENNRDKLRKRDLARYYENKEPFKERLKKWKEENKDHWREVQKKWRQQNPGYSSRWREENKERINQQERERLLSDPEYKLTRTCRGMLRRALKLTGNRKDDRSFKMLGYTPDELKSHLERNMAPDMSWENYGKLWHIDHVIPVSEMVSHGIKDPKIINALSNLMPEYAKDNMSKGSRFALSPPPVL